MAGQDELTVGRRLLRLEALADIERLVAEYCHGADKRDRERFMAVWHPEAVWDVGAYKFTGKDQIREAIERQWSTQLQGFHWTSNLSVEFDSTSESAMGECDVIAFTQKPDSAWLRSAGTYRDIYRRHQGRWLILQRRATVHFTLGSTDLRDAEDRRPRSPVDTPEVVSAPAARTESTVT